MKYIRTKDNIFEVENEKPNNIIFCKPRHTKMLVEIDENVYEMKNIIIKREIGKDQWEDEIINRADTIEELCDKFVIVRKDFTESINGSMAWLQKVKRFYEKNKIEVLEIYGAIWTNRGLIYIAKMNEKGELELL